MVLYDKERKKALDNPSSIAPKAMKYCRRIEIFSENIAHYLYPICTLEIKFIEKGKIICLQKMISLL